MLSNIYLKVYGFVFLLTEQGEARSYPIWPLFFSFTIFKMAQHQTLRVHLVSFSTIILCFFFFLIKQLQRCGANKTD